MTTTIRKPMKYTPEKIYTHFNTIRDTVVLDQELKWFCVEPITLRQWNELRPEFKHTRKITVYLMAPNGVSLAARQTASQVSGLMGSELFDVQIAPVDNGLIKTEGHFFDLGKREIPPKVSPEIPADDVFHQDFLCSLNIQVLDDNGKTGRGVDKSGWRVLAWNREGCSLGYYGEELAKNSWLEVHLDGGGRKAFHGIVYTREDLRKVIDLTR